jgi:hypothetical protein
MTHIKICLYTLMLRFEFSTCKVDQWLYRKLITYTIIYGRWLGLGVDLNVPNYHYLGGVDSILLQCLCGDPPPVRAHNPVPGSGVQARRVKENVFSLFARTSSCSEEKSEGKVFSLFLEHLLKKGGNKYPPWIFWYFPPLREAPIHRRWTALLPRKQDTHIFGKISTNNGVNRAPEEQWCQQGSRRTMVSTGLVVLFLSWLCLCTHLCDASFHTLRCFIFHFSSKPPLRDGLFHCRR